MNIIETKRERLKYLREKRIELIRRRIEIENNMLGKYDSVIYAGSTYFEMLFCGLSKNMTKEQQKKLNARYAQMKVAKKKPYNQYNVALLEKVRAEEKRVRKEIKWLNFEVGKMGFYDNYFSKQAIISTKELFGKDTFYDLTSDEKEIYIRVNERAKEELNKKD